MRATKPVGQGAASKKYDVLTALGAHACSGDKHRQRLILRFMVLVTARYNWQRDELSMGRAEIARLWGVDERTVKRDLAKLKVVGWLAVKRQAARGRVTVYSIDWGIVCEDTRSAWSQVGPDFCARMAASTGHDASAGKGENVVAFPVRPTGSSEWDDVLAHFYRTDPAFFASWLSQVQRSNRTADTLELSAPTAFHAQYLTTHALPRLLKTLEDIDPEVRRIIITKR